MKNVLITGGARGIGQALSLTFAQNGYHVLLHYHTSEEAAKKTAAEILEAGGRCTLLSGDLSKDADVKELADKALAIGTPDTVILNAGVSVSGLLPDMTEDDYQAVMGINFKSGYTLSKLLYPAMVRQKSGNMLFISSMWGIAGASCEALYAASKGAVITLSKSLAKELAPSGIRVNCIAPGVIRTDMLKEYTIEDLEALRQETPLGRLGTPQDVANAALFLASEKASFITGQTLSVDGGFLL